jgi:hypothetical protein
MGHFIAKKETTSHLSLRSMTLRLSRFKASMARFTARRWLALQLIFLQVQTILLIVLLLHYRNSIRRRSQLLRAAVLDPKNSPWQHLLEKGDLSSFLLLTGLSRQAFYLLLDTIIPPGHHLRQRKRKKEDSGPYLLMGNWDFCSFIWAVLCHTSISALFLELRHLCVHV